MSKVEVSKSEDILNALAKVQNPQANRDKFIEVNHYFGDPSKSFRAIHVTGTNGKGSVTTKIAYGLSHLGFKTGLYTSPHIRTFRERIQINGEMISDEDFAEILTTVLKVAEGLNFFELLTMVAFIYFQRENVDYAVIEVGIGGSFDATNVIHPVLSVITSISLDHMNVLGPTLEHIAENKAGIIKKGAPVVLGPTSVYPSILERAESVGSLVYVTASHPDWMVENTEIAKKALCLLYPDFPEIDLSIVPPCRFEKRVIQGVTAIFDIAHNEDGVKKLFSRLAVEFPNKPLYVIFSMCRDKDVAAATQIIGGAAKSVFPYEVRGNARLLSKVELKSMLPNCVEEIENWIEPEGVLVVTGSAHIMQPVYDFLSACSMKLMKSKS